MLRVLSSKIFRENLNDFALPMVAFDDFDNLISKRNIDNKNYKFCLPVSIGDFKEVNVPACFSNDIEELRDFVNYQKNVNRRKAFILSDFKVTDLNEICYSGVICTYRRKGLTNYYDEGTRLSITLKNPILTYAKEGISPRDLKADIEITYDHTSNPYCGFANISSLNGNFDIEKYKYVIYQAYMASSKIHEVSKYYDGEEYEEYALFFIDKNYNINLYEIVGRESFYGQTNYNSDTINRELDYINNLDEDVKIKKI